MSLHSDHVTTVMKWLYAHRGHPNPNDAMSVDAWSSILEGANLQAVEDVVIDHIQSGEDLFLMPSDILERVRAGGR